MSLFLAAHEKSHGFDTNACHRLGFIHSARMSLLTSSDDSSPDGKACTWRKKKRVKTIDSRCLFEQQHFTKRCREDARVPFTTAIEAFEAAFASNKIEMGGCPALRLQGPNLWYAYSVRAWRPDPLRSPLSTVVFVDHWQAARSSDG